MPWLLDTNILSEIRRSKPEPKVVAFITALPLDELYISAVTLAGLRFGIEGTAAAYRGSGSLVRPGLLAPIILSAALSIFFAGVNGISSRKNTRRGCM